MASQSLANRPQAVPCEPSGITMVIRYLCCWPGMIHSPRTTSAVTSGTPSSAALFMAATTKLPTASG